MSNFHYDTYAGEDAAKKGSGGGNANLKTTPVESALGTNVQDINTAFNKGTKDSDVSTYKPQKGE